MSAVNYLWPEIKKEKDFLNALIKMHSLIQTWTFWQIVNAWGLTNCLRGVYFALKKSFFLLICYPCLGVCMGTPRALSNWDSPTLATYPWRGYHKGSGQYYDPSSLATYPWWVHGYPKGLWALLRFSNFLATYPWWVHGYPKGPRAILKFSIFSYSPFTCALVPQGLWPLLRFSSFND